MSDSNLSTRSDRYTSEMDDEWARSPFERDRDRILYTKELRRLKDVTQVVRAGESYLYHDRLSHSLKVAQVGRSLAQLIKNRPRNEDVDFGSVLDPNVVEAACLAHDLGHPPFGHLSEEALDEKVREKTNISQEDSDGDNELGEWAEKKDIESAELPMFGYEGNAQSFRIVTRLASHYKTDAGLNLTKATLNAILKYPRSRKDDDDKWGYYPSEKERYNWTRKGVSEGKTLEAEIMDYADDVTYAIHDVADFYKGGLIPLDHLLGEAKRREETRQRLTQQQKEEIAEEENRDIGDICDDEVEGCDEELPSKPTLTEFETYLEESDEMTLKQTTVEGFFQGLSRFPGVRDNLLTPFSGTDEENDTLGRLVSNLVSRYLNSSDQKNPEFVYLNDQQGTDGEYCLYLDRQFREQVWILKKLTFYYVISDSSLVGQQRGQRRIIEELFELLYEESGRDDVDSSAIPSPYDDWLEDENSDVDWPSPIHQRARIVADMIAMMTEPQAVTLHKRLTGDTPGSLQDEIVR